MKARMITALLLLLAAVLGWVLPSAVTAISDQRQEGRIETLELEPISLQYHDTLEKLKWFEELYSKSLRLPILSGQLLNASEAMQIAKNFVMQTGLCEQVSVITGRTELQNVGISGKDYGMILWEIRLILDDDEGKSAYVMIDDASGLILGFSIHAGDYDTDTVLKAYKEHLVSVIGDTSSISFEPLSLKDRTPTYRLSIWNDEREVGGMKIHFSETISFNCPTIED